MRQSPSASDIRHGVHSLLALRAPSASICPSEVARALAPDDWRALMPRIRAAAAAMAQEGTIRITQGTMTIDPVALIDGTVHGPIRLRRAQG